MKFKNVKYQKPTEEYFKNSAFHEKINKVEKDDFTWENLKSFIKFRSDQTNNSKLVENLNKYYDLIRKIYPENDTDFVSLQAVNIFKNVLKDVNLNFLSQKCKESLTVLCGIGLNDNVLNDIFSVIKLISQYMSNDDIDILIKCGNNDIYKYICNNEMFGSNLKCNFKIDDRDVQLFMQCLKKTDTSTSNNLKQHKIYDMKSLLKPIADENQVDLDELVQSVKDILTRNADNNNMLQNDLFDLLGFNFMHILEELAQNSKCYLEATDTSNLDNIKTTKNIPIKKKWDFEEYYENQVSLNKDTLNKDYPYVFDELASVKKLASANKVALPKEAVKKSNNIFESIYIPAGSKSSKMPETKLIEINSLDPIGQKGFTGIKQLNIIQSIVFKSAYGSNENLLISAPTGAGKTNIAMLTILHQIKQHIGESNKIMTDQFKIIYVAPMKALAAEMTENFKSKLECLGVRVRECTGDIQLSKTELDSTQMIVTTPEKYDVITRKSNGDTSLVEKVKLLIIDEVHLLHENRGSVIETLVARTLRQIESTQKPIRIVGLSATLPNYLDVANFLHVDPYKGLFYFDRRFRPVPLHQTLIGVHGNSNEVENNLDNVCYDKMKEMLKQDKQVMIFVHSRNATQRIARIMMLKKRQDRDFNNQEIDKREMRIVESLCKGSNIKYNKETEISKDHYMALKRLEKSGDSCLKEIVPAGFACHHAGMLRSDRKYVEDNFRNGFIRVLVCTSTLAWGVNLPAHTVIIRGTEYYNSETSSFVDIGILDVLQIFGRAGRPQFRDEGHGMILCKHNKLNYYTNLLYQQTPIESTFLKSLNDNLNAEIALGTVTDVDEAIQWLSFTYLFVRMRCNPLHYGINWNEIKTDPELHKERRSFIIESARQLDQAHLIRFDERCGYMTITDAGRLASHYYIAFETAKDVENNFLSHATEFDIMNLVSAASEFSQMKVRDDETEELNDLRYESCHIKISDDNTSNESKANILIQSYISNYKPKSFSLVSDYNYVAQNVGRIFRYLFEKAMNSGWSTATSSMLKFCKKTEWKTWSTHPLWQFQQEIKFKVLEKLEHLNLSLDRMSSMDAREIESIVRNNQNGQDLKRFASYIPKMDIEVDVKPITRSVLRVHVRIRPTFRWNDKYHGTVMQSFWIWVEDPNTELIHHSEPLLISKKQVIQHETMEVVFAIPLDSNVPDMYILRVVSDKWIGSDEIVDIPFNNLILPDLYPPNTDLLDLRPLPLTALKNSAFENIYSFSHFNPIQTQMFHAVYHTDGNILLGAPTGSGKTVAAELAIFRLLAKYPGKKCIYIAPLKALVRERMDEWKIKFQQKLNKKLVELTGDIAPDMRAVAQADIIITTPEKWDGVSRNWQERNFVQDVGLIIIDEIHLLGEDRGPVLEVIISRNNFISAQTKFPIRVVGLSTALANAKDLADWLHIDPRSHGLYNFRSSVRPVPLQVHIQGFPSRHYCPRMASMNKPIYQGIRIHSPDRPVLIFVSSRRQTRLTAYDLVTYCTAECNPKQWTSLNEVDLKYVSDNVKDNDLKLLLSYGVGIHHAGLHERDRKVVEYLFRDEKIQILVATSTLAWGVNFPAHLVIVKGTEYYDAETKRYKDYPITDVLQMIGRAGRPQFDTDGKALVMCQDIKKEFYKKFLNQPFPVESSLLKVLPDHLNAEIYAGTITSKQSAMNYLTYTFFFRRLLMNPNYYKLEAVDHVSINRYLSGLIQNIVNELELSHCVEVDSDDNNTLTSGTLGRIASYYYLKHKSLRLFHEKLSKNSTVEQIIDILSSTEEFAELPVRHNEDQFNLELSKQIPIKINSQWTMESPRTKTNILLQCHWSHLDLPITDYYIDQKLVLDQSIRILQAMIDAAANEGFLATCLTMVNIIQQIVQGQWVHDNPLLQLPGVNSGILHQIKGHQGYEITTLPEFIKEVGGKYHRLKTILSHGFDRKELDKIFEVVNKYPIMQISVKLRGEERPVDTSNQTSQLVQCSSIKKVKKTKTDDDDDGEEEEVEVEIDEAEYKCVIPSSVRSGQKLQSWSSTGRTNEAIWLPVYSDTEYVLEIQLKRVNYRDNDGIPKAYTPRFGKSKDEGYIIILGEPDIQELHAIKRVPMIRQKNTRVLLNFISPLQPGRYVFAVYVMSDCYLSMDQQIPLFLDVVDKK